MLESSLKNKSRSHFPPPDSKSLRLGHAAFEMPPSHGMMFEVYYSNAPLLSALKQLLVYSERVRKQSFAPHRIFSKRLKRQRSFMQFFTRQSYVNEKKFALGTQILFPAMFFLLRVTVAKCFYYFFVFIFYEIFVPGNTKT